MPIVIKKRITLEFLGEDYKDSYLVFRSIPLRDYELIIKEIDKNSDDNIKSLKFILDTLQVYFVEGKFQAEEVSKEDLPDLDQASSMRIFEILTGQLDPKAETSSTTPSSTEPQSL